MSIRIALFVVAASLVGVTSAHAGKPVVSGPVSVGVGETITCVAINVGTKDLSDIAVSVFRGETGPAEVGTTCATEVPTGVCGVQSELNVSGVRYCSVALSGSTKSIRARLCNLDTGDCSELR